MGVRGMGEASEWALAMAHAVAELREAAGLTVQELAERIDKDPSYLYARLKGRAPFNVNDWDLIAKAFGVHPLEIARIAARYASSESLALEPTAVVDVNELARRLSALASAPRTTGPDFDLDVLLLLAAEREVDLTPQIWDDLIAGSFGQDVPLRILELIAEYTGVATAYLTTFDDTQVVDATEAQLELRRAIREVGADSVLARSVGDVSPSALRAIASSLRDVKRPKP